MAGAALGLCIAGPASAASPTLGTATDKKTDPQALSAADRLLTAMGYDQMMQRTCDALVAKMGPMMKSSIEAKTGEKADDALIKLITDIQSKFMHETLVDSPNLRRAVATIYANRFTVGELDHLADLYKDPVMRKWADVTPDASAEMFPLVQGMIESHRDDLQRRIKDAVTDYYAAKAPSPTS
jgi:hypothetical protein